MIFPTAQAEVRFRNAILEEVQAAINRVESCDLQVCSSTTIHICAGKYDVTLCSEIRDVFVLENTMCISCWKKKNVQATQIDLQVCCSDGIVMLPSLLLASTCPLLSRCLFL